MVNTSFSQEISSVYKFKKQGQRGYFYYFELDSLVLYKSGEFHQIYKYNYHQINYKEVKGNWVIENGKLMLNIKAETRGPDDVWENSTGKYVYQMKRKKLFPIIYGFFPNSGKKLKLL